MVQIEVAAESVRISPHGSRDHLVGFVFLREGTVPLDISILLALSPRKLRSILRYISHADHFQAAETDAGDRLTYPHSGTTNQHIEQHALSKGLHRRQSSAGKVPQSLPSFSGTLLARARSRQLLTASPCYRWTWVDYWRSHKGFLSACSSTGFLAQAIRALEAGNLEKST